MKIFKFILFIYFLSISINFSYALNCSDSGDNQKIEACIKKSNKHSITDYICIRGSLEDVTYQYILDKKFKEVDKQAKLFIKNLEDGKDVYFGENKKFNFTEGIDLIDKKFGEFGEFWQKYDNLCKSNSGSIIEETMTCLSSDGDNGVSSIAGFASILKGGECVDLYTTKLNIYQNVALNVLKYNKAKILSDNKKKFTQIQRTKYEKLIDMLMLNISYIERIWKKLPTKTRNVHN